MREHENGALAFGTMTVPRRERLTFYQRKEFHMELLIDHVSKRFKDKRAVNDISLELTPGVWGLLGANGAGKTTLMRMIAGIMQPTSGQVV